MVEGGLDAQPCTLILLIFGISCCWYLESFVGTIIHRLKGGYRKKIILSLDPLAIIYGGKNVETARSDLKMVQNCKIS